MSEKDCLSANWYAVGVKDALSGKEKPQTQKHRNSCSKYGVNVSGMRYLKGYEKGLRKFCSNKEAYNLGLETNDRHHFCEDVNPKFSSFFEQGNAIFQVEQIKSDLIGSSKECSSDSDCNDSLSCSLINDDCEVGDYACSSSCSEEKSCVSKSDTTDYGNWVTVNICE